MHARWAPESLGKVYDARNYRAAGSKDIPSPITRTHGMGACNDDCGCIEFNGCFRDSFLGCNPTAEQIDAALGTLESILDSATTCCHIPGPLTGTITDTPAVKEGCTGEQVRYFTISDPCGNTARICRRVFWISDIDPPVISIISSNPSAVQVGPGQYLIELPCNSTSEDAQDALDSVVVSVEDGCCCQDIQPTFEDYSNSSGCSSSITRVWTAKDGCLNTAQLSVEVTWISDQNGPVITVTSTCNDPICDLGCNPDESAIEDALGSAEVTDNCGIEDFTVQDSLPTIDGCRKTVTRTWTAIDVCGNTTTASRTVTWKEDTGRPVITVTGYTPTVPVCNPTNDQINNAFGTASATDDCSSSDKINLLFVDGTDTTNGCTKSRTRTWTAIDECGNTATLSRTVTWTVDTTGPTFTNCPANKTVPCGTSPLPFDTPTVTDDCSASENISLTHTDSTSGNTTTRTWTATDACGNTATCSQSITVGTCCTKGCSQGFWKNSKNLWDQTTDPIAIAAGFTTNTSFWTFFGIPAGSCGLNSTLTMGNAIDLNGGNCNNLARQAVAAFLNIGTYGASCYVFPPGTSSAATLKTAIQNALATCNCTTLASQLADSNTLYEPDSGCGPSLRPTVTSSNKVSAPSRPIVKNGKRTFGAKNF